MANPKSKILPGIMSTFVVVIMFFCIDAFAPMLMGDLNLFGTNVIGAGLGIVTVGVMCFAKQRPLASIGLIFEPRRILRGLVVGGGMALLPLLAVFGVQTVIYAVTKMPSLAPDFVTPNADGEMSVVKIGIFAVACGVSALMQEMVFRGYIVRSMRPQYPFTDANVVQAMLSVTLPVVLIIRNLVYGHYSFIDGFKKIVFIVAVVLFYVAYTFFSSIKRGVVTRVSGDIWPSFVGNFLFMFVGGSLFVQNSIITSYSSMLKLLGAEAISLLVASIYYTRQYNHNKKRREEHDKRVAEHMEKLRQEELNREADPNIEGISQKSVKEIMQQHQQKIIESVGSHSHHHNPESDDSITSLDEVRNNKE